MSGQPEHARTKVTGHIAEVMQQPARSRAEELKVMRRWTKEAEPQARGQVIQALGVIERGADGVERAVAATMVRMLVATFMRGRFDERMTTDVMNLLALRLDEPEVVHELLRALVLGSFQRSDVGFAVARLAGRAAERKLAASLWQIVRVMIETVPWHESVQEEWAATALDFAVSSGCETERLIRAWLDLHGSVPAWMAPAVEQRTELLVSPHMPCRWVWPLHAAAPTTKGWHLLAGSADHQCKSLDAVAFGSTLDVALETLDRALGEERDPARRLALAGWLTELGGQS